MIDKKNYELLKENYGDVSSWAVWAPERDTAKSGTSDMSVFRRSDLLNTLNTGYIFVGLNGSSTHNKNDTRPESEKRYWCNFHSAYRYQNDYKLRYALKDTKYWGSYITDVIKEFPEVDSGKVQKYINAHPEVVKKNIDLLRHEISLLGGKPVLVAMGDMSYNILKQNIRDLKILKIKHYSYTIGKEDYREEVIRILNSN